MRRARKRDTCGRTSQLSKCGTTSQKRKSPSWKDCSGSFTQRMREPIASTNRSILRSSRMFAPKVPRSGSLEWFGASSEQWSRPERSDTVRRATTTCITSFTTSSAPASQQWPSSSTPPSRSAVQQAGSSRIHRAASSDTEASVKGCVRSRQSLSSIKAPTWQECH